MAHSERRRDGSRAIVGEVKRWWSCVLVTVGVGVVGCSSGPGHTSSASKRRGQARTTASSTLASDSTTELTAPVIPKDEGMLPCDPKDQSTLGIEGCLEEQVAELHGQINALAATIFRKLRTRPSRQRFVDGEAEWLHFVGVVCNSRSDIYEGGSAAPIAAGNCAIDRAREHLTDLKSFDSVLSPH